MGKWLLVILALAGFLRIVGLNIVPPELFGDEIDVGYQAYSLLHTGQDLYRQILPTYIRSLSEPRAPLLMYATVPTIAAFGNTAWGVRIPSAVWGSLAPIILFLLVYQTTKSKSLSLLSSLSLAFMPWHIYYSRAAFEVVIMLDLLMLGTLLFFKKRFALCLLMFALAMYTYSTAVLFVPLLILALVLLQRRIPRSSDRGMKRQSSDEVRQQKYPDRRVVGYLLSKKIPSFLSILLFVILVAPLAYHIAFGFASSRFNNISLTNDPDETKKMLLLRQQNPTLAGRIFINQYEATFHRFWDNYIRSFSTEFLFVRGDPNSRQSIQVIGQLLPLTFPFMLVGLWWLVSRKQWIWLFWLALAPIPASLTVGGGFHATRLFLMIPPLAVAIGAGIYQFKKSTLVSAAIVFLISIQLVWVGYYYWVYYPRVSQRWWQVGFQNAFAKLSEISTQYSRVFINNTYEPSLIRFLFWTKYSPVAFHRQFTTDQAQKEIAPYYDGFTLDGKYFFGNFTETNWPSHLLPGAVYLVSQRDNIGGGWDWRTSPPDNVQVLFTSTTWDDSPIFYLVTRK